MKNIFVKDLKKGDSVFDEDFLVLESDKALDKNGAEYLKITLVDNTGRIDGKVWSDKLSFLDKNIFTPGNLLTISSKVEEFKGVFQLNVTDARISDETNLDNFLESSVIPAEEMFEELIKEINTIKHSDLKKVVLAIVNDKTISETLKYLPASKTVHHEFRSGLLQHILEMIEISKSLRRFYPGINYDILTAGIVLHDLGKIQEFDYSGIGVKYSTSGSLIGHINLGVLTFTKFAEGKLDKDIYEHICHLILSHHGTHEFGSPVLPATTEAFALTNIDNLSAKARTADSATTLIIEGEEFSEYNKWLGGVRLWKAASIKKQDNDTKETKTAEPEVPALDEPQLF